MTRALRWTFALVVLDALAAAPRADEKAELAAWIKESFAKTEHRVPMRDGVRLHTVIYAPKERSEPLPILLRRTPYSCRPYGPDAFPESLGPSDAFVRAGFVFVQQDVRGAWNSEGEFVDVRPQHPLPRPQGAVDESTDTWDTVEWLVTNVTGNNGRVGMWGVSYPGFYAAAGAIDTHPALVAVSPQAPIADWWFDDFHHHGAFFLPHAFLFYSGFGKPRPAPTTERPDGIDIGTPDGYDFFLRLGSLANANERYFKGDIAFWNEFAAHPDYDAFWKARNLLPHLKGIRCAVMTVGGWFDAEDLYGPLKIYEAIERQNPGASNVLVIGPWSHGGWARTDGDQLGQARFDAKTSLWYREEVEFPFFDRVLKMKDGGAPEATVFETGANRWRTFESWPPRGVATRRLHLRDGGRLSFEAAGPGESRWDEFTSDPAKPVPHTQEIARGMNKEYMTEDQRFAARRPDVLVWTSEPLEDALTLAGPSVAELLVTTTREDADWVVKLVDVFPDGEPDPPGLAAHHKMGGYHMLVRGEVMRGRYREGYETPKPFAPGESAAVAVPLLDVLHTFERGHRIQVQVQSTWFPLVDRNPQKWVPNVYLARDEDFASATHRVLRGSSLRVGVLPAPGAAR